MPRPKGTPPGWSGTLTQASPGLNTEPPPPITLERSGKPPPLHAMCKESASRTHQNLPEAIPDPDVQLLPVGHVDEPALRHLQHLLHQHLVRGPDPHLLEAQPSGSLRRGLRAHGGCGVGGVGAGTSEDLGRPSSPGWPQECCGEMAAPEALGPTVSAWQRDLLSGSHSPLPISDPSCTWAPTSALETVSRSPRCWGPLTASKGKGSRAVRAP